MDREKTIARIDELLEQVRSQLDRDPEPAPSVTDPPAPFFRTPLTSPGEPRSQLMRSEQTIFDDLAHLCTSKGFIHALALLSWRDNVLYLDDGITAESLARTNSPRRLTRTEFTTLVGLLMRAPVDYSLPATEVLTSYLQQGESLLEELHGSMLPADPQKFLAEATDEGAPNPFASGENLREPIFYTAESAYAFQYRDLAPRKYRRDAAWLRTNKRVDIDVAHAVCRCLPELLSEQLRSATSGRRPAEQWTLLPAFLVSPAELSSRAGCPLDDVRRFLEAFTQPAHESNESFTSLHAFNAAYAYPFIRHGPDTFLMLQYQGAMAAFYETPFYWMLEDDAYVEAASRHRGAFAEELATERLGQVFSKGRVFQNVELRRSRKETLGEIDVLVTFGDRLIVVQAKSKRLSLKARAGEDRELRSDFKLAVQDAVDQCFSCAKALLDRSVKLHGRDGAPISLTNTPRTIFPVTLLTDHYPALSFQSQQLLAAKTTEEIVAPVVTDVFAFDAMTEMLDSPLRFLSYLNRRSRFAGEILTDHELDLLAYHLKRNLWLESDIDLKYVQGDSDLYLAMAARRDGIPGPETPEGILPLFQGTRFEDILSQIDDQPHPLAIDLGLFFLELNETTVRKINEQLEKIVQGAGTDGTHYRFAFGIGNRGPALTAHCNQLPREQAEALLRADCRQALDRADCSFGVSLDPDGTIKTVGKLVRAEQDR